MANIYKCRPSTLLDISDPYTSFCFDEACAYIIQKLEDGEEPIFKAKYSSFKDLYAQYEN
nr:MAG TPA: hypothetical protein [Caudoviricetes sp.]